MSKLFEMENLKSEDFGTLLDELAKDLARFNEFKTVDWIAENPKETGFLRCIEAIDNAFAGNPPIKFVEDILKYFNQKKRELEINIIPTLLKSMGLTNAKTVSGYEVNLKPEIQFEPLSKMPENLKLKFFAWLEKHGAKDLIKDVLQLGKGEFDKKLEKFLDDEGYVYKQDRDIHYQTLKSFLNKIAEDRRAGGKEEFPPESILKIEMFDIAKIKGNKE